MTVSIHLLQFKSKSIMEAERKKVGKQDIALEDRLEEGPDKLRKKKKMELRSQVSPWLFHLYVPPHL